LIHVLGLRKALLIGSLPTSYNGFYITPVS
jgi:hypothetical protein